MASATGYRLILHLLKSLPDTDYLWIQKPRFSPDEDPPRNPDFIIVHVARGGVVALDLKEWAEVAQLDAHHAVMRGANGQFIAESNPVLVAQSTAGEVSRRFKKLNTDLHRHKRIQWGRLPWIGAVALPNLTPEFLRRCEAAGAWLPGQVIGPAEMTPEAFAAALDRLPWPSRPPEAMDAAAVDLIRGAVNPRLLIRDGKGKLTGVLTVTQDELIHRPLPRQGQAGPRPLLPDDFLSKEAIEAIETLSVQLVRGVAGSGKTLVLARRAEYLAREYPHLNVLVLTANPDLVADLKRRVPQSKRMTILSFNKLCKRILGADWAKPFDVATWLARHYLDLLEQHRLTADFVSDEILWRKHLGLTDNHKYLTVARTGRGSRLGKDKRQVVNQLFDAYQQHHARQALVDKADMAYLALATLEKQGAKAPQFDSILLDEAHDFPPAWVQVVLKVLNPKGSLFMCDDPTQSQYPAYSWQQKGVNVAGRTRVLRVPFRCTVEITTAAYSLLLVDRKLRDWEAMTIPDLSSYDLNSGGKPLLAACRSEAHEIAYVHESVLLAMRLGVKPQDIAVLCHDKLMVKQYVDLNLEHNIHVLPFERMKGLEFKTVYLPGLGTIFNDARGGNEDATRDVRRTLFTAMTRARVFLVLSYHGLRPPELNVLEPYVQIAQPG
jgi:hypothetical protein